MITIFIQSADRRVNYQPIRYLFNGITLEMNLPIYKAMKGVHLISWLMTAERKGLNKINWKAKKAIGQLRRYNILVIYLQSRVGIKPGFYHKAQPSGFYEGGFFGVLWVLCGFYKSKSLSIITPTTSCYLTVNRVFLCKQNWSNEKQPDHD